MGVSMCGFCTVWMCGAFCNNVGVCMMGIVIVWVFMSNILLSMT